MSLTDIVLYDVNAERSDALVVEMGQQCVLCIPQSIDIVAHFVLSGAISVDVGESPAPVIVREGEFGVLFYGSSHRIHIGSKPPAQEHVVASWPSGDEPATLSIGTGDAKARFISAALRVIHHPVTIKTHYPLPELLHLKHDGQALLLDTVLATDPAQIDLACSGPGASGFINTLMNMHLAHAVRCAFEQTKRSIPLQKNNSDSVRTAKMRPILFAIRLLRTHPEKNWTVASLAHELGLSRSVLAAKFRAHVGIGPMEYLSNVRMEIAAKALQDNIDLPLSTISRQVGYDRESSFSRAFKSHFGVSPSAFSTSHSEMRPASDGA